MQRHIFLPKIHSVKQVYTKKSGRPRLLSWWVYSSDQSVRWWVPFLAGKQCEMISLQPYLDTCWTCRTEFRNWCWYCSSSLGTNTQLSEKWWICIFLVFHFQFWEHLLNSLIMTSKNQLLPFNKRENTTVFLWCNCSSFQWSLNKAWIKPEFWLMLMYWLT